MEVVDRGCQGGCRWGMSRMLKMGEYHRGCIWGMSRRLEMGDVKEVGDGGCQRGCRKGISWRS